MTPEKNPQLTLELPPSANALLCDNVTTANNSNEAGYSGLMLVPRGTCTYEQKALNAQRLGATGIAIYGTLASRYSLNTTTNHTTNSDYEYTQDDILYPQKFFDYDCDKGRAEIPSSNIQMTPLPYNAEHNDPILSGGPSSLCVQNSPDSLVNCPSQACLLTGQNSTSSSSSSSSSSSGLLLEACCAWDLHVWLFEDPAFTKNSVVIPAVYLTMEQAKVLLEEMRVNPVQTTLYARYRPAYNVSALLIWGLGVTVAAIAAFLSASEYTSATKDIFAHHMRTASTRSSSTTVQAGDRSQNTNEEITQMSYQRAPPAEETLELSAGHALGFVVMASSGLLILFFFKVHALC
jgi:hypothetical protein